MRQLTFDFEAAPAAVASGAARPVPTAKRDRGRLAWLTGEAAEDAVARVYEARGLTVLARRWRGESGEVDLVLRAPDSYVFCEVKRARTFDAALARLRRGQLQRIYSAASEYLALTEEGQLAPVRFDVAAVDRIGAVQLREAAFGHF